MDQVKKKINGSLLIVILMSVVYAAYFSWFTIGRNNKTNSSRFDLGNMEQTVWNVVHGHGFTQTNPYGTDQVSRLAFHADFFMLLIAPIYAVAQHPETLLILQALLLATGGLAAYLIGFKILKNQYWAMLVAVMYFINPAINWANIFDWHAVTMATPLILWTFWCMLKRKYITTLVLLIVTILTKEQVGFSMAAISLFAWFIQGQPQWGKLLVGVSLGWALLAMLVIIPLAQHQANQSSVVYQSDLGDSAGSVIKGSISHPLTLLKTVTSGYNLKYVWQMVSSTGGLAILSPLTLAAAPDLFINMISQKPAQHLLLSHYNSVTTPWLLIGFIFGLAWLLKIVNKPQSLPMKIILTMAVAGWVIGITGYSAYALGPLPGAVNDNSKVVKWRNEYAPIIRDWSSKIGSNEAVSVTNNVGAHFARREHFYSFPLGVEQSDYVIVLQGHTTPVVASQQQVSNKLAELKASPDWTVVEEHGDLTILISNRGKL
jgi:uncharacterized membrane protein